MQHDAPPIARYADLLKEKVASTRALLSDLSPPSPAVFPSPPEGFRMRAEFRIWHEGEDSFYAMFDPGAPREPLRVNDFPIACARIQTLMPQVLARVKASMALRRKLFQVEFLSTLAGDSLVTLVYHRPLDDAWEAQARDMAEALQVSVIGRSRKRKTVIGRDHVTEVLDVDGTRYTYRQYEQAFTQPNAMVNTAMLEWAGASAAGLGGDLLELYCGNGNFTLPLSRHFGTVIATELSKVSIRAAQHNLAENGIQNTHMIRLAAEEVSQALARTREFRRLQVLPQPLDQYRLNTVFVDPPRAGLDPATLDTVSRFDNILYISCNPHTLRDNLLVLDRDFRIVRFGLFDQFPYTDHMECGVLL
ncbi:MAG: tRNA (uridine(54)-C5)-methyltransferase TrmA, partial [Chromatocurvus sp.]